MSVGGRRRRLMIALRGLIELYRRSKRCGRRCLIPSVLCIRRLVSCIRGRIVLRLGWLPHGYLDPLDRVHILIPLDGQSPLIHLSIVRSAHLGTATSFQGAALLRSVQGCFVPVWNSRGRVGRRRRNEVGGDAQPRWRRPGRQRPKGCSAGR